MKMTKIFVAVIALFSVFACASVDDGGGSNAPKIEWSEQGSVVGEWNLSSWSGKSDSAPRVYLALYEDGNFDMYQQAFSVLWYHYEGTYTISEDNLLTGVYSDGEPWSTSYRVFFGYEEGTFADTDMPASAPIHIRLVNEKNDKEISIYDTTTIPDEVVEEAGVPEMVRSVVLERFL